LREAAQNNLCGLFSGKISRIEEKVNGNFLGIRIAPVFVGSIMRLLLCLLLLSGWALAQSPKDLVEQGARSVKTEGCRAAVPYFQTAAQQEPTNTDAWFQLGMCQGRLGQQEAKITAMRHILTVQPDSVPARHQLVLALRTLGRNADAAEQITALRRYNAALASDLQRLFAQSDASVRLAQR
jgi:tetratricopeptide (TPR) repeat protein